MASTSWYNLCAVAYLGALFLYIVNLSVNSPKVRRFATVICSVGFLTQTTGLVFRWLEAGAVEIAAVERAQDVTLSGISYFIIYTQHPPWSNLYEILVMMAWGLVLVFLVSEVKFRIRIAGIGALLAALLSFGIASLTTDATITPLVPALQSWWLHIHVISSTVGYASITVAAASSLLFIVAAKDRVTLTGFAGGTMIGSAILLLILGRFDEVFRTRVYKIKLLGVDREGDLVPLGKMTQGAFRTWYEPSPGVGLLLIASIVACAVAGVLLIKSRRAMADDVNGAPFGWAKAVYLAAFGITTAMLGLILFNDMNGVNIVPEELRAALEPQIARGFQIPPINTWTFSIKSNQWDLGLFGMVWVAQLFATACVMKPVYVRSLLPDFRALDRAAYYILLVATALQTVVLVTGALWAHYAWGRYWGWDPKETGALVVWVVLLAYLHARTTPGMAGIPAAVISVFAFFVMIAGFLGVNLGWFADGLHSYGSS
ncbi:MAG: cytochrome c biogenesis protein CcsA [Deltaproteobacteria bacterium]|nr:cytochrome c biogenesis protein CcsA [Deltaproteobacteria bacterium]